MIKNEFGEILDYSAHEAFSIPYFWDSVEYFFYHVIVYLCKFLLCFQVFLQLYLDFHDIRYLVTVAKAFTI